MPERISHVKRFYGSGEGDARAWVDVERIDQLTRNSGSGPTFQATVQRIRWQDDGDDSANGTRSMHTVTISNPNGPESVDVLAIDNCAFSPRQNDAVLRKFRNRDDDNNVARETTSVRIESEDDTSQYVDVEIVDKFHDRDSDGRVIFRMRNQEYEDNANGPGGPPINPPYRLDPYQAVIGVSWGKKDHHHQSPSDDDSKYMWFEIRVQEEVDWYNRSGNNSSIVWVHRIHSASPWPYPEVDSWGFPTSHDMDWIFPPPFHEPNPDKNDPGNPPQGSHQEWTIAVNYSDGARISAGLPVEEVYK